MEMNRASKAIHIDDQSQVGEARREAVALAGAVGFQETDASKIAIAVTEAASNILKHGGGGEILLRAIQAGVEMLAIDKGTGIANLEKSLHDGHSTAGTQGIGLGAISRLASVFDIYTATGLGTAIMARFYSSDRSPLHGMQPDSVLEIGVAEGPYPGEDASGDGWGFAGPCIFLADGLGHGFQAAKAAEAAVAAFQDNWRLPARDAIEAVHFALRSTRGAAVALASFEVDSRLVRFCGLGNISGAILTDGTSRSMVSHNGTAGHEIHRIAHFDYPWPEGALTILHTDGISAKWNMQSYPGLVNRDPSLIAAVLYRDFRRQRDDATVLVVKARPQLPTGGAC
jgi:anti-sigma regulatory factor (Ser/Thr protein kinase)